MKHFYHNSAAVLIGFAVLVIAPRLALGSDKTDVKRGPAGDWESMRDIRPRHYLCHATSDPISIDALALAPAWQTAEWTENFVDIQGDRGPKPRFRTRAKMLWDDKFFYVYAELDEPHVWATITKKNSVIFRDNDFEIFIGPDGSNHHYHEFEMNALNTIWELSLDKPYRNGGPVHDPDNVPGLRSAVHIRGTLNDPRDRDQGWSVMIAFPWQGLKKYAGQMACPPKEGDTWRVGFSRVEWLIDVVAGKYHKIAHPEDNWIWSPQGIIDMHAPERWGFVQFTHKPQGQGKFMPLADWPAREALMEVYHRQQSFKRINDRYAADFKELGWNPRPTSALPAGFLKLEPTGDGFLATASMPGSDGKIIKLHTRQDSLLWAEPYHEK